MRFGQTLSEMVKVEWKEYAVDYRGLKKCLPRDGDDFDPSEVATVPEFWELFQSSTVSVASFYRLKKQWAEDEVTTLENQVEKLKLSKMPGSMLTTTLDVEEVHSSLENFNVEVGYVNEFLNINHTAFRKILKKYDKRTGSQLQTAKLQDVVQEHPFLDGSAMDDIFRRVQLLTEMLDEIRELPEGSSLRKSRKGTVSYRKGSFHRSASRKIIEASNDFMEKMIANSPLFASNTPKVAPRFEVDEVEFGGELGEGEFSIVREVKNFNIDDSCPICVIQEFQKMAATKDTNTEKERRIRRTSFYIDEIDDESFYVDHVDEDQEFATNRGFMKHHCFRDGSARYAIKQLKKSLDGTKLADGAIDICIESKFLSVLSHPNIIKLCGTGGIPGHQSAFIILDRLYHTLGSKIEHWKTLEVRNRGFCGMNKKTHKLQLLWNERLLAAYDVASALEYLHTNQIMYRDLKPENIGFDVRGTAKVFDFGLAKELLNKDKICDDQFNASGRTGTRRYMAPEVVLCKYYGKPVDVYSFAIVLWQTMSLETPFKGYDYEKHAKFVVQKHKRPVMGKDWPTLLKEMMKSAWDNDPMKRPTFTQICATLRGELQDYVDVISRSQQLMDTTRSFHDNTR